MHDGKPNQCCVDDHERNVKDSLGTGTNDNQSINQSKFIFFNKHQTYNITKIQNKSQPFTSKVHITVNMRLKSAI